MLSFYEPLQQKTDLWHDPQTCHWLYWQRSVMCFDSLHLLITQCHSLLNSLKCKQAGTRWGISWNTEKFAVLVWKQRNLISKDKNLSTLWIKCPGYLSANRAHPQPSLCPIGDIKQVFCSRLQSGTLSSVRQDHIVYNSPVLVYDKFLPNKGVLLQSLCEVALPFSGGWQLNFQLERNHFL